MPGPWPPIPVGGRAKTWLPPNPYDWQHFYDYMGAVAGGAMPDQQGHWPSEYKLPGHPRTEVGGVDTRTGLQYVPGGLGNAEAMQEPPIQQMARARTRSIFGVPITPRGTRTFAAGLAQGLSGIQAGGGFGNFLQGFSGGLGGALRGGEVYDEGQRRQQGQANDDTRLALEGQRVDLEQKRYDQSLVPDAPQQSALMEKIALLEGTGMPHNDAVIKALGGAEPSGGNEFDRFLAMDPSTREQFKQYKNIGDNPDTAGIDPSTLDGPTLDMLAHVYLQTGQAPYFRGKNASEAQMKVFNRAAGIAPGANVAQNAADYKTDVQSQGKVKSLYDTSTAFEKTATANAKLVRSALKGVPDWHFRFGNRVMRDLLNQAGSPAISKFRTALHVMDTEYARVLGSPGAAGGVITDTQQKMIKDMVSGDMTIPQIIESLDMLAADAKNKRMMYSDQLDQIRKRTSYTPGTDTTNPHTNIDANDTGGATEETWERGPDGKLRRVK